MANISFDKIQFNNYLADVKNSIKSEDIAALNSIFTECDTETENGEKRADNKLTGDEVRNFFSKLSANLKRIVDKYLSGINEDYAKENVQTEGKQDTRGIELKEIESTKTQKEQEQFKQSLEKAKSILLENKDKLGLTDDEIKYINSTTVESVNYGAARRVKEDDAIRFNVNMQNELCTVGNMIKTLLHEVNHAVKNSTYDSQAEERECESKAIKRAYTLYTQNKDLNAPIYQTRDGKIYNISDFKDKNSLNQFIDMWLDECNYRGLPED